MPNFRDFGLYWEKAFLLSSVAFDVSSVVPSTFVASLSGPREASNEVVYLSSSSASSSAQEASSETSSSSVMNSVMPFMSSCMGVEGQSGAGSDRDPMIRLGEDTKDIRTARDFSVRGVMGTGEHSFPVASVPPARSEIWNENVSERRRK